MIMKDTRLQNIISFSSFVKICVIYVRKFKKQTFLYHDILVTKEYGTANGQESRLVWEAELAKSLLTYPQKVYDGESLKSRG